MTEPTTTSIGKKSASFHFCCKIDLFQFSGKIILKKRRSPTLSGICGVCSDRASSHFHYGAQNVKICFACRGFFRRMVRNKNLPQPRHCRGKTGQCIIDPQTRKKCTYCRYMKCCDLGMKAEFVMTKEEYQKRLQKKTHRKRANESFNFNAELVSYMEFQLDFQKEKIPENSR